MQAPLVPLRVSDRQTTLPTPDVLVSSLRISATVMNLIKFLRATAISILNLKITPLYRSRWRFGWSYHNRNF